MDGKVCLFPSRCKIVNYGSQLRDWHPCDMLRPMTSWSTDSFTSSTELRCLLKNSQDENTVLCPIWQWACSRSPAPIWTGSMVSFTIAASHRGRRQVLGNCNSYQKFTFLVRILTLNSNLFSKKHSNFFSNYPFWLLSILVWKPPPPPLNDISFLVCEFNYLTTMIAHFSPLHPLSCYHIIQLFSLIFHLLFFFLLPVGRESLFITVPYHVWSSLTRLSVLSCRFWNHMW
jgi:hypothetical protein